MKKAFILLFVVFMSVVSFEGFLRFSPFSSGISPVVYDKDIGMWHKKNFSSILVKDCYRNKFYFDEKGRVKNNYIYNRNKKDIIILGDSQVEALMIENDKVIHNVLHEGLNGKYNVLNYGLSGSGPTQQLEILKNKVDMSSLDSVVHFIFLENDLNDLGKNRLSSANRPKVRLEFETLDKYNVIKPKEYSFKERFRDFLGNFELYAYLKKSFYYYKSQLNNKKDIIKKEFTENEFYIKDEDYKWLQLKGSIFQINKILKNKNITYKVIVYSSDEFVANYTKRSKELIGFLEQLSIRNLNISQFMKELNSKKKISFNCDSHWNGNTHRSLSEYIIEEMY